MDKNNPENIRSKKGFTISPSDTLRENPWGAAEGTIPNQNVKSAAQSNSQIISFNNSVRGMLIDGDVRKNYLLIGNTWTINGVIPGGKYPKGNEEGTSKLAKSTMGTYFWRRIVFIVTPAAIQETSRP